MNWTKTPPTRSGAYLWRPSANDKSCVVEVTTDYYWQAGMATPLTKNTGGEWCALVPLEEVEKAYREGWRDCLFSDTIIDGNYATSRARKIVEGEV